MSKSQDPNNPHFERPAGFTVYDHQAFDVCNDKAAFVKNWKVLREAAPSDPPQRLQHASTPSQLPLWPEPQRASPNDFLRSAIFAPILGKSREYVKRTAIKGQGGFLAYFQGEKLDQSDFDVWLQAIHLARCSPLGTECTFKAGYFLRSLKRKTGGSDYDWLKEVFGRLQGSWIELKINEKWCRFNFINFSAGNDDKKLLKISFNEKFIELFAPNAWTALQWEERCKLKGKPLALWLHGYYASHADPFPLKAQTIYALSGQKAPFRSFIPKLKTALNEVASVAAGFKWSIDEDHLVTVDHTPSPAQMRHLARKNTRS